MKKNSTFCDHHLHRCFYRLVCALKTLDFFGVKFKFQDIYIYIYIYVIIFLLGACFVNSIYFRVYILKLFLFLLLGCRIMDS